MAAPSPDDPNALGSDGLPKFAHTTTQTLEGRKALSFRCRTRSKASLRAPEQCQEQQVGGAWSVSMDFRQLEHDRCSMAWWLQARQQRHRAAANKEVARSQQGMTRSKT
ncbi:hypothetical protein HaLaN_23717, partial [Haematococcus lacustris]